MTTLFSFETLGPFLWRSTVLTGFAYALNATLLRRCPAHRYLTLLTVLLFTPVIWSTATLKLALPALAPHVTSSTSSEVTPVASSPSGDDVRAHPLGRSPPRERAVERAGELDCGPRRGGAET